MKLLTLLALVLLIASLVPLVAFGRRKGRWASRRKKATKKTRKEKGHHSNKKRSGNKKKHHDNRTPSGWTERINKGGAALALDGAGASLGNTVHIALLTSQGERGGSYSRIRSAQITTTHHTTSTTPHRRPRKWGNSAGTAE